MPLVYEELRNLAAAGGRVNLETRMASGPLQQIDAGVLVEIGVFGGEKSMHHMFGQRLHRHHRHNQQRICLKQCRTWRM